LGIALLEALETRSYWAHLLDSAESNFYI